MKTCCGMDICCSIDTEEPEEGFGGTPLTPARRAALAHIGIDEGWVEGEMTDEDAIQILAFHKFLNNGEWAVIPSENERMFVVDQRTYSFATGKIDAKEYLDES